MREGRKGKVLHVYRSIFAFLFNRDIAENGGVFVTYARSLSSTAPKGAAARPKSHQLNPDLFGKAPMPPPQAGASLRRDGRIHRKVSVTKGAFKGYAGVIKDVTGVMARVELHTNSKVITINIESLKEQKCAFPCCSRILVADSHYRPDGTLIPLLERPGGGPGYGARPGGSGASSVGGFSSGSNGASLGSSMSSRTPFPSYGGRTPAPGWSGGRTPAPQYDGGRTPAPGGSGSGAWDASGRTPMVQSGGSGTLPFF